MSGSNEIQETINPSLQTTTFLFWIIQLIFFFFLSRLPPFQVTSKFLGLSGRTTLTQLAYNTFFPFIKLPAFILLPANILRICTNTPHYLIRTCHYLHPWFDPEGVEVTDQIRIFDLIRFMPTPPRSRVLPSQIWWGEGGLMYSYWIFRIGVFK